VFYGCLCVLKFKTGHSLFQIRPLEVETGQYPDLRYSVTAGMGSVSPRVSWAGEGFALQPDPRPDLPQGVGPGKGLRFCLMKLGPFPDQCHARRATILLMRCPPQTFCANGHGQCANAHDRRGLRPGESNRGGGRRGHGKIMVRERRGSRSRRRRWCRAECRVRFDRRNAAAPASTAKCVVAGAA